MTSKNPGTPQITTGELVETLQTQINKEENIQNQRQSITDDDLIKAINVSMKQDGNTNTKVSKSNQITTDELGKTLQTQINEEDNIQNQTQGITDDDLIKALDVSMKQDGNNGILGSLHSWKNILRKDLDTEKYKEPKLPIAIYASKLIETADLFFYCIFAPFMRILKDNILDLKNKNSEQFNQYIYQVITSLKEKANIEDETPYDDDSLREKKAKMIINGLNKLKEMKNQQISSYVESGISVLKLLVRLQATLFTMLIPMNTKIMLYPLYGMAKLMVLYLKAYVGIVNIVLKQLVKSDLSADVVNELMELGEMNTKDYTKETLQEMIADKMSMVNGMIDVLDIVSQMLIERSPDKLFEMLSERFTYALEQMKSNCPL